MEMYLPVKRDRISIVEFTRKTFCNFHYEIKKDKNKAEPYLRHPGTHSGDHRGAQIRDVPARGTAGLQPLPLFEGAPDIFSVTLRNLLRMINRDSQAYTTSTL